MHMSLLDLLCPTAFQTWQEGQSTYAIKHSSGGIKDSSAGDDAKQVNGGDDDGCG